MDLNQHLGIGAVVEGNEAEVVVPPVNAAVVVAPPPPILIHGAIMQRIQEAGGHDPHYIGVKILVDSDRSRVCLTGQPNRARLNEFLTPNERIQLWPNPAGTTGFIFPVTGMSLHPGQYNLRLGYHQNHGTYFSRWGAIFQENGADTDWVVRVWGFRMEDEGPAFVFAFQPLPQNQN